ncbi:MAG: DMT family transporter [Flavobacteriales bacterium]|jgi:drug/metabolite transporter (DMT)-like permease|nr:DMT family transporter [Flavobacteriales bacterium]
MLLSSLSFALVNLCVKILSDKPNLFPEIQNYPVQELVLFRSLVSLSICVAIIKAKKIPFFGNNKKWLLTRGIAGVTSLTLFFFTLENLPMAIATTVQYLSPIFTILIAIYLVNEKVKPIQWLFFAISFSGIIVIGWDGNSSGSIELIWLVLGLCSAVISGVAYNAIIQCSKTDEPVTVVMYFPLVATPVMLVLCYAWGYVIPQGIEWLLLLLIGVLTQIAQVSMTRAFNSASASKITPIKYVGAVYSVVIGLFVFDEKLSLYSSFGIVLILIGVLLNTFLKQRKLAK